MKSLFVQFGGTYRKENDYIIPNFELLDYFTQETLQKLCLYHKEKIAEDTDLSLLLGRISNDSFSALVTNKRDKIPIC